MEEINFSTDRSNTSLMRDCGMVDGMSTHGIFSVQCHDAAGNLKWEDTIENLVVDSGKKMQLDNCFANFTYTASYMGLISSVSYGTGVAAGDLMTNIVAGLQWREAGSANAPSFANRATLTWNAASTSGATSKALTSAAQFTITGTPGTVKGCFVVVNGTNAIANTTGTLYSAGLFTGGDKAVTTSDVLSVTYTTSINAG